MAFNFRTVAVIGAILVLILGLWWVWFAGGSSLELDDSGKRRSAPAISMDPVLQSGLNVETPSSEDASPIRSEARSPAVGQQMPFVDPRLELAGPDQIRRARFIAVMQRDGFAKEIQELEEQYDGSPTSYWKFLQASLDHAMREQSVESLDKGLAYFMVIRNQKDATRFQRIFGDDPYIGYGPFEGPSTGNGMLYVPMTNSQVIADLRSACKQVLQEIVKAYIDHHNSKSNPERLQVYQAWLSDGGRLQGMDKEVYLMSAHRIVWSKADALLRFVDD
jgi:hypothetical protein